MANKWEFERARDRAWRLAMDIGEWNSYDPYTGMSGWFEWRAVNRAVDRFEVETGWLIEDLLKECERRCSYRWVYFSGMTILLGKSNDY